jgi:hypothetical protein
MADVFYVVISFWRCPLRGAGFDKGLGVGFDLSHGFTVVDFLAAGWALVKLQSWH